MTTQTAPTTVAPATEGPLLGIGAAAARAGVSERALRYYEELGLLNPAGRTPGGLRRYSDQDLDRVGRIRDLQKLLGLNLDEVAVVLRNEDRLAEIKAAYRDKGLAQTRRQALLKECLALQEDLRRTVETKRSAIDEFLADLDARMGRVRELLRGGR